MTTIFALNRFCAEATVEITMATGIREGDRVSYPIDMYAEGWYRGKRGISTVSSITTTTYGDKVVAVKYGLKDEYDKYNAEDLELITE